MKNNNQKDISIVYGGYFIVGIVFMLVNLVLNPMEPREPWDDIMITTGSDMIWSCSILGLISLLITGPHYEKKLSVSTKVTHLILMILYTFFFSWLIYADSVEQPFIEHAYRANHLQQVIIDYYWQIVVLSGLLYWIVVVIPFFKGKLTNNR